MEQSASTIEYVTVTLTASELAKLLGLPEGDWQRYEKTWATDDSGSHSIEGLKLTRKVA